VNAKSEYWFANNGLCLNLTKAKILKFENTSQNNVLFQLQCKTQHLQDGKNIKFLGIEIDKFVGTSPQMQNGPFRAVQR
jgi:hypothetical protein